MLGDTGEFCMTKTASGLPSLLLPCPKCLVRMTSKTTDRTSTSAEANETFGCVECGVEVTRTHSHHQYAA
jgi:hypothetical protein